MASSDVFILAGLPDHLDPGLSDGRVEYSSPSPTTNSKVSGTSVSWREDAIELMHMAKAHGKPRDMFGMQNLVKS